MLEKLSRYKDIISTLVKYGLAEWISRINVDFIKTAYENNVSEIVVDTSLAERVRLAFTELGPVFIKLGQVLSTREDLVGEEIAEELRILQADVPCDSPEVIRRIIEEEFSCTVEDIFSKFEFTPLGSASIGQVHLGYLKNGQEVVVKIQHDNIQEIVNIDLEILLDLARLTHKHVKESRPYLPIKVCEEFQRAMQKELDFSLEKKNIERFSENFAEDSNVFIPQTYDKYCSDKIITMDRVVGISISEKEKLKKKKYDLKKLAEDGANTFLSMIFDHGFYHADPHPGNIMVMEGAKIGLIDFGMTGYLGEGLREDLEDILDCIIEQETFRFLKILRKLSNSPINCEDIMLQNEVSEFMEMYTSMSANNLDISKALQDMNSILRRYKIVLPSSIFMLIKLIVLLEGTSRMLNPNFVIVTVIKPYHQKAIWRRFSLNRQKKLFKNLYKDMEKVIGVVPQSIVEIAEKLQKGEYSLNLQSKQFTRAVNRLVFGLITAALLLGSSILIAFEGKPTINKVSIPGIIGYIISFYFGTKLLWAIYASGDIKRE